MNAGMLRYIRKIINYPLNYLYADIIARIAYRLILNRPIDNTALKNWKNTLVLDRSKLMSLVNSLFVSAEYNQLITNSACGDVLHYLHLERCKLIQRLPQGDFIIDLGGAAPNDPRGSLLAMGYPHKFDRLMIVDLPLNESFEQRQAKETYDVVATKSGEVRYIYRNFCEINKMNIEENSVDLFWMGQTVEHIAEQELDKLLRWIFKYLKPGGHYCFDTPNRLITSIQCPDQYVHPDHKIEYYFQDLVKKVKAAGFEIIETLGIGLAEEILKQNKYLPGSIIKDISINERPEHSYIFYFKTSKPLQTK
jgi:SAM-dependent methyltransferase